MAITLGIELEHEAEGRWIAEIPSVPGAKVCGETPSNAIAKVEALALRLLATDLECGQCSPDDFSVSFVIRSGHFAGLPTSPFTERRI